jgi:hypothetical protein
MCNLNENEGGYAFFDRFEQLLQQDMRLIEARQLSQRAHEAEACEQQLDETLCIEFVPRPVITPQGIPLMRGRGFLFA